MKKKTATFARSAGSARRASKAEASRNGASARSARTAALAWLGREIEYLLTEARTEIAYFQAERPKFAREYAARADALQDVIEWIESQQTEETRARNVRISDGGQKASKLH
jgi:hypothetical protein